MDLRAKTEECLILRSRDFQEADRILTVFSRYRGKLSCLARGVRRPNSRLKASTQVFCYSRLEITGRTRGGRPAAGGSLLLVTQGETVESMPPLREDLDKIACASYLGEMLDLALPDCKPQENIFILAVTCLKLLAAAPAEKQFMLLKFFEIRLLAELGWRPDFNRCCRCGSKLAFSQKDWLIVSPEAGGLLCLSCAMAAGCNNSAPSVSHGCARLLDSLLNWELRRLFNLRINPELRREVNLALWSFLDHHLGQGSSRARSNLQIYYDI